MYIKAVRVTVRPHDVNDVYSELRTSVEFGDGRRLESSEVLMNDDFTSLFDYYFDKAREAIRAEAKK